MKKLILFLLGTFLIATAGAQTSQKIEILMKHSQTNVKCTHCGKSIDVDFSFPSKINLEKTDPLYGQIVVYYQAKLYLLASEAKSHFKDECPVARNGIHAPREGEIITSEQKEWFNTKWLEEE